MVKEKEAWKGQNEWNLVGPSSLSPLCGRRTDGERAEEMTISSCSKNWEWVGMKSFLGQVNTGWS